MYDVASLPKTAQEAVDLGGRLFFDNKPCEKGHPGVKRVNCLNPIKSRCDTCLKEDNRRKAAKKRLDPEYRAKMNAQISKINKKRYAEDAQFRASVSAKAHTSRNRIKFSVYGFDEEAYLEMAENQGWVCACCKRPETRRMPDKSVQPLCVDHDHDTGAVRSLLCSACNTALGILQEDAEWIKALLKYVEVRTKHSSLLDQIMDGMTVKKEAWDKLNPEELEQFKEELFTYLRERGYPHPTKSVSEMLHQIDLAKRYMSAQSLVKGGRISQTHHCTGTLWGFFPHFSSVRCNKMLSPEEAYADDTLLRRAINYRLTSGTHASYTVFRRTIATTYGTQQVSNFRPTAAAEIYRMLGGGEVYDPCAGWGGRMVGAEISGCVTRYVGVDASKKTADCLKELASHLPLVTEIHHACSEKFVPSGEFDIAFTSPPYFNHEMYALDAMQSAVAYKTKNEWMSGFLIPMMRNAASVLKKGGKLCINIANVPSFPDLVNAMDSAAREIPGLRFHSFYNIAMTSRNTPGETKQEPLYIYENA